MERWRDQRRQESRRRLREIAAIAATLLVVPSAAVIGLKLPIDASGVLAPIFDLPQTAFGRVRSATEGAVHLTRSEGEPTERFAGSFDAPFEPPVPAKLRRADRRRAPAPTVHRTSVPGPGVDGAASEGDVADAPARPSPDADARPPVTPRDRSAHTATDPPKGGPAPHAGTPTLDEGTSADHRADGERQDPAPPSNDESPATTPPLDGAPTETGDETSRPPDGLGSGGSTPGNEPATQPAGDSGETSEMGETSGPGAGDGLESLSGTETGDPDLPELGDEAEPPPSDGGPGALEPGRDGATDTRDDTDGPTPDESSGEESPGTGVESDGDDAGGDHVEDGETGHGQGNHGDHSHGNGDDQDEHGNGHDNGSGPHDQCQGSGQGQDNGHGEENGNGNCPGQGVANGHDDDHDHGADHEQDGLVAVPFGLALLGGWKRGAQILRRRTAA